MISDSRTAEVRCAKAWSECRLLLLVSVRFPCHSFWVARYVARICKVKQVWKCLEGAWICGSGGTQNKDLSRPPTTKQVTARIFSETKQWFSQSFRFLFRALQHRHRPPAPKSVAMRERRWWFLLALASLLGYRHTPWCGPWTRHHGRELVVRHAKDEIAKRLGRVSTPRRRESMESEEDWDCLVVAKSPRLLFLCCLYW